MKKFYGIIAVAVASAVAMAIVTFDPLTGTGFAGKGDVQLVFGWNNAQLQSCANFDSGVGCVETRYAAVNIVGTEYSWTCYNTNNEHVQNRARVVGVETTISGVPTFVSRVRNQVTGFFFNGYNGTETIVEGEQYHEGPPLWSCPANPSGWVLVEESKSETPVNESLNGGLEIRDRRSATNPWLPLAITQ